MLYKRIYGWQRADLMADIPLSIAKLPSATYFPESIFVLDKGLCFQSVQCGKDERRNSILLLGQRASWWAESEKLLQGQAVFFPSLTLTCKVQAVRFIMSGTLCWSTIGWWQWYIWQYHRWYCQIYHCHHPMVDQQRVPDIMNLTAWTLQVSVREGKKTACPWSSFSDSAHQEALCPRSRMLFLLSSFPHCTDWKHKPLSNTKMDSGKYVADGNFAMLRGISAMRSALCHPYILLYSITGLIFFWSFQPNTHLLVTYHQSKTARRVHLPFRRWKK